MGPTNLAARITRESRDELVGMLQRENEHLQ